MRHRTAGFRRALVALDGTARAERVVPWLRRLVVPGGEIHLLTVLAPARAPVFDGQRHDVDRIESSERLAALAALGTLAGRLRADGVRSTGHVRFGEPVRTILDTAGDVDVDVIALTTGEHRRWWWPSRDGVVECVLRRSRLPVLIAREDGQGGA
jgi:nucleotide-binding universal stress UspA family protein